jgi:hypothetical protein
MVKRNSVFRLEEDDLRELSGGRAFRRLLTWSRLQTMRI